MFENEAIEARISLLENGAEIELKSDHYSLARIAYDLGEVKSLYYGKITVDVEKSNPETIVKIYELYYKEGKEIKCQYLDESGIGLAPEGADRAEIAVLVRGYDAGVVKIGEPSYTELDAYKPRPVKIAAVNVTPKLEPGV